MLNQSHVPFGASDPSSTWRPGEGRPPSWKAAVDPLGVFRSAPPARGRPPFPRFLCDGRGVSIRAPARGRPDDELQQICTEVFRSAPPRGGDRGRIGRGVGRMRFDPRPREGATLANPRGDCAAKFRSAPPRGGDTSADRISPGKSVFRSAPPRGGELEPIIVEPDRLLVSIRAPARGRPGSCWRSMSRTRFDPRPREGATTSALSSGFLPPGFDPRPREGATGEGAGARRDADVSIRAPARGRPGRPSAEPIARTFRSAPPRGGDGIPAANTSSTRTFRSAPPRGGD